MSFRQFDGSVYVLGWVGGGALSCFSICYHPSFKYPGGSQERAWAVPGWTEERSTQVESIESSTQTPIPIPLSQRPQPQPPHICSVDIYAVTTFPCLEEALQLGLVSERPWVGLAMGMGSMLGPETFEGTIGNRLSDMKPGD